MYHVDIFGIMNLCKRVTDKKSKTRKKNILFFPVLLGEVELA